MKKNILYFTLFLLLMLGIEKVYASDLCTSSKSRDLQKKVNQIEAKADLVFDENKNASFTITFSNVDKDLMLFFYGDYYEPKDGVIVLENAFEGGNTYNFKFYGGYDHSCVEEFVGYKTLKVKKYNKYSQMKECEENSEWELCDEWYDGEIIDEEDFLNKLDEYLHSDEKKEVIAQKDKEETRKKLIIAAVVSVVVVGTAWCVVKVRKTKKVKITSKETKENNENK